MLHSPVISTFCAGGIQRYLEAFPDCGFFSGKNFVFDERLVVGGTVASERRPEVVGKCMICSAKTDDYSAFAAESLEAPSR
jgi:predicted sulfurtransferase